VPGRSGRAYADWLAERGAAFAAGVEVATLDPFRGYANAIRDELDDAVAVLDAFHARQTRRRHGRRRPPPRRQATLHHRGRKNDPLYKIARVLRAGAERLTPRQWDRLEAGLRGGDPNCEVALAWQCYERLRSWDRLPDLAEAKNRVLKILDTFHTCPVKEIARLGKTLRRWKDAFLAYFTTRRSNNGPAEAIGVIELHRRLARGFRNPANHRVRMLLAAGGPTPRTTTT
jgi:transposase